MSRQKKAAKTSRHSNRPGAQTERPFCFQALPPKLTAPELVPPQVQHAARQVLPQVRHAVQMPRPNIISAQTADLPVLPPNPVEVPAERPQAAKSLPVETKADVDPSHSCAAPEYPLAAKRLGQSGTVIVKFRIEMDGSISDSQIVSSSGYPRLDDAAREGLSLCHFKPGTVDGQPIQSWAQIQYVWKLSPR